MKSTTGAAELPEALRVPLDSIHADVGYLCGRLLNGSLTQGQVVASIRRRIDAAKLAAQALSAAQAGVPTGLVIADIGFRWDNEKLQHVPKLVIEFEPVPANSPCDAKGWKDRDAIAAMLTAAPQPNPSPAPAQPGQEGEREAIIRAAVAAMPYTNPLVADDLLEGHTMHTEADDIVAIWHAARAAPQPATADALDAMMLDALKHAQKVLNHHNLPLECGPINEAILAAQREAKP